jgi:hypothetical protein
MGEYDDLTVAELKDLLREAGLPLSGKKADLVARLDDAGADAPVTRQTQTTTLMTTTTLTTKRNGTTRR